MVSANPGIPIPSFGTTSNKNGGCGNKSKTKKVKMSVEDGAAKRPTTATTNSLAQWNAPALMQLDVALQHWFRKRKQFETNTSQRAVKISSANKNDSNAIMMTMEDFYALVRKLDWNQTQAQAPAAELDEKAIGGEQPAKPVSKPIVADEKVHPHHLQVRGLIWEERLWHDLICAAANPELSATEKSAAEQVNQKYLYKVHVATRSLELLPHTGEDTRRLLSPSAATTFNMAWSNRIRTMIALHAKLKSKEKEEAAKKVQAQQAAATPAAKAVPTFTAIITKGMTVDERVRARAKAKEEQEHYHQEQMKREPPRKTNVDRAWMIQLADALWNHARSRLQRQNYQLPGKLASNSLLHPKQQETSSSTRTPSKREGTNRCVMTFADVIQAISKSRLGEASPTQIAKALTELEGYAHPKKWIVVMREYQTDHAAAGTARRAPSTSKQNKSSKAASFHWSKSATTIFITPDHYPAVRSQLTGDPLVSRSTSIKLKDATRAKINVQPAHTSKDTKVVVTQDTTKSKVQAAVNRRKRPSPVMSKNLLEKFDTTSPIIPSENKASKRFKLITSTAK